MADIAEQGFPQATDVAVSPPPPPPPPPPPTPGAQVTARQLAAAGEQTRVKAGAGI